MTFLAQYDTAIVLLVGICIGYAFGRNSADKPIISSAVGNVGKSGDNDDLTAGYIQDELYDPNEVGGVIPTMREDNV